MWAGMVTDDLEVESHNKTPWLLCEDNVFRGRQLIMSLNRYFGRLGEQFVDMQTDDIDLAKGGSGKLMGHRNLC